MRLARIAITPVWVIAVTCRVVLSLAAIPFAALFDFALRSDRAAREESELAFDSDDPGYDVDAEYCDHMRGVSGSCARCEGT